MMFRRTTKQDARMMSTDRILVSHPGSLPRPATLSELLLRQEASETIDAPELGHQVEIATAHVIGKQVEAGVDVGNDGEQSRVGFRDRRNGLRFWHPRGSRIRGGSRSSG
jgi:hypothetical protein